MRRGGSCGANAFPISQAPYSPAGLPPGEKKPHKQAESGGPDPCLKGGCVRATVEGKNQARAQVFHEEHWELFECPGNPKRSLTRLATLQLPVPHPRKPRAGDQEGLPWSALRCRGLGWRPRFSGQVGLTGNTNDIQSSHGAAGNKARASGSQLCLSAWIIHNRFAVPVGC